MIDDARGGPDAGAVCLNYCFMHSENDHVHADRKATNVSQEKLLIAALDVNQLVIKLF